MDDTNEALCNEASIMAYKIAMLNNPIDEKHCVELALDHLEDIGRLGFSDYVPDAVRLLYERGVLVPREKTKAEERAEIRAMEKRLGGRIRRG